MADTSLTILVAEDDIATQTLLQRFLTRSGHTVYMANNGAQAVELYQQHKPDIILTDINMPTMNGLEAIKTIRLQQLDDFWVPILILSASEQDQDIIAGLKSGADDYLPKPIKLEVLNAKIEAMQRLVTLQKTNLANQHILKALYEELEEEQLLAKKVGDKILGHGALDHPNIEYWLQPNRYFSGDLIAAAQSIDDTLYVMLADATGHGLSAALPTLTIARTFHAMAKKALPLSSIVTEMNTSAKRLLPIDRFVATNVFRIDFKLKTIEAWCGGIPKTLLINQSGNLVHDFKSQHLAIGILPSETFNDSIEKWQWEEPIELIAYSDGLTEATSPEGVFFGEKRLLNIVKATPTKQRVEHIKQAVLCHLNDDHGQDDISLISVYCG
ncbi:MAG: SpoIIE family protein phosphatase [Gammaproteobacteria bacterium]|nr:SpoIIE family protein phosphatase [Gammaproteobacteria bacterium]